MIFGVPFCLREGRLSNSSLIKSKLNGALVTVSLDRGWTKVDNVKKKRH